MTLESIEVEKRTIVKCKNAPMNTLRLSLPMFLTSNKTRTCEGINSKLKHSSRSTRRAWDNILWYVYSILEKTPHWRWIKGDNIIKTSIIWQKTYTFCKSPLKNKHLLFLNKPVAVDWLFCICALQTKSQNQSQNQNWKSVSSYIIDIQLYHLMVMSKDVNNG